MMNRKADNDQLLADVLSEAAPADFREALLDSTLRLARRRRRFRQVRRGTMVLAVLGLAAILVWRYVPQHRAVVPPAAASYRLVHTQPLPASGIVTTQPFSPHRLIASAATVELVRTTAISGGFRVINDDELLALVAPRPAALVRRGPDWEELVFVNPEDQKGFPVN
jgi:hypothetical protein